ncbi:MAG: RNA polymerase subunit sigma [Proteobacteria bacterium]|nr:MAG: RNA polymerase subunit sigma [Pseudomonadota bacterium]
MSTHPSLSTVPPSPSPAPRPARGAVVRHLPIGDSAEALVKALRDGHPHAAATLYDRYAAHVRRVLARTLGVDHELDDALQDSFVQALRGVARLEEPRRLQAWLTSVAVFTARGLIRRRARRRWLALSSPERLAEREAPMASSEDREALRATYAILDTLKADDRIAFALRTIDGMTLEEVAAACGCSLATAKRRIKRAEQRFVARARRHPTLAAWLETGDRWRTR